MNNKNGMDIVLILAGVYLIYLSIRLFRQSSGEPGSPVFIILFAVVGLVFIGLGLFRILKKK